MHDVSLGETIRDYLTGEDVALTTYEDLRQGLARLLVEEKGYPAERLKPRRPVYALIDGKEYSRLADLAALDERGAPLLVILFCAGDPTTYQRECLAVARLIADGPSPLALVTDTHEAVLLATSTGEQLATGMQAVPDWERLQILAKERPAAPLDAQRREKEGRILYAYSESLFTCCSYAACAASSKGARWKE